MKGAVAFTLAASLAASAAAHGHGHQRFHNKKNASPVEKREPDVVIEWVVGATETVYELEGEIVDVKEAEERMDDGELVVVGESTPTFTPPPAPEPTTTSKPEMGAQFYEKSSTSESSTSTMEPEPEPETTTSEAPKPTKEAPSNNGPSLGGGQGVDREFPSGEIDCSEFPSDYGAVPLEWLEMSGWSGLQRTPKFSFGVMSISEIHTGIAGDGCAPGTMCSYACPPGYQKTQWSQAQGDSGQSVGGLWCNKDGKLELTRQAHPTLCERGEGGVFIQNDLDEVVNTCRTDYPGTEAMVIPAQAEPGSKVEVCNPSQKDYYVWQDKATTAQWYINKKGYNLMNACNWNSAVDPEGAGNWSPTILGVGKAPDGNTYISIFQNLPTSHAKLDFNIEVTGDVNSKCGYKNGQYIGGENGCTTTMKNGGHAVIRYY